MQKIKKILRSGVQICNKITLKSIIKLFSGSMLSAKLLPESGVDATTWTILNTNVSRS